MFLNLEENQAVEYLGANFIIAKPPSDLVEVLLKDPKTSRHFRAPIAEIKCVPKIDDTDPQDVTNLRPIEALSEKEKGKAEHRWSIIQPLLAERGNKQAVLDAAAANGISKSTLYDWINKYEIAGGLLGLVDREGRGKPGQMRLEEKIRRIIIECIDTYAMNGKTFNETYMAIWDRCEQEGLKVPHQNTLRNHLNLYTKEQRLAALKGPRTAKQKYGSAAGGMHEAISPLHWVEVDHTVADVMLVDPTTGEVIGRPWVTVLIDVYSRMILGFYASFDAPGAYGTGRAIVHAMLPKDAWLKDLGLQQNSWLCWGKMTNIRCDNAKEFKGDMLKEASKTYGMNFDFRPPKVPERGAYIERFLGTFGTWLKDVKGSTGVSKELRSLAKPEKTAALSIQDFQKWLTMVITIYHDDYHSGIEMTPLAKWKHGLYNPATGIGTPGIYQDEQRLLLDFMPFEKRTIQRTGVKIKKIFYWHDVLRKYINSVDEEAKGKHGSNRPKREFIFKVDPREISKIHFLEPEMGTYFEIPYSKISGPSMSKWDYRKAVVDLRKNGEKIDQDSIFARHRFLKTLQDNAEKRTKQARRDTARQDQMKRETKVTAPTTKPEQRAQTQFTLTTDEIKPYEIDYGTKSFK